MIVKVKKMTIEARVKAVLSKPYTRRLTPDESGGYVVSVLEFPGCIAEGDTAEQALANYERAAESWVEVSLSHDREIKEPVDFDGYSGKVALRLPRSLHRQIAELAEMEDVSINQLLVTSISYYAGEKSTSNTFNNAVAEFMKFSELFRAPVQSIDTTYSNYFMSLNLINNQSRDNSVFIDSSRLTLPTGPLISRTELNFRPLEKQT